MSRVAELNHALIESEEIDFNKAAGEFMFLGLRLTEGVSVEKFCSRFGKAPGEVYPHIPDWIEAALVEEKEGFLKLTPKGLLLANSLFVQFM
jgi:oxygen-independent coproporphyrinogen-3 oxidase